MIAALGPPRHLRRPTCPLPQHKLDATPCLLQRLRPRSRRRATELKAPARPARAPAPPARHVPTPRGCRRVGQGAPAPLEPGGAAFRRSPPLTTAARSPAGSMRLLPPPGWCRADLGLGYFQALALALPLAPACALWLHAVGRRRPPGLARAAAVVPVLLFNVLLPKIFCGLHAPGGINDIDTATLSVFMGECRARALCRAVLCWRCPPHNRPTPLRPPAST